MLKNPRIALSFIALTLSARPDFNRIDRHALNPPPEATASVDRLTAYLTRPARNETEKVRAIYRWLTHHFEYDLTAYTIPGRQKLTMDQLLQTRSAVCDGYATLFEALCAEAGIRAVKISGHAKGIRYTIGDTFSGSSNHAWNAVWLNGKWQLIDATWGSGYMEEGRYVREFDDFYFLTPPEQLITTHFPEDKKWQLLDTPVDKQTFESMPNLRTPWFKYGLNFVTPLIGTLICDTEWAVTLSAPENIRVTAILLGNAQVPERHWTLIQYENGHCRIKARFPRQGDHTLRVFAKQSQDPTSYAWAADIAVHATENTENISPFPKVYEDYSAMRAALLAPLTRVLPKNQSVQFIIRIPDADDAILIFGKQPHPMQRNDDLFTATVTIPKNHIRIAVPDPGSGKYSVLAEFLGE